MISVFQMHVLLVNITSHFFSDIAKSLPTLDVPLTTLTGSVSPALILIFSPSLEYVVTLRMDTSLI